MSKVLVQSLYSLTADNSGVMTPSENARKLKAIRSRAIGLRELARAIGWDASRYQYYEDSYKKPYMPLELIDLIRPQLLGRGEPPITEAELDSLLPPPRKSASPTDQVPQGAGARAESFGAYIHNMREVRGISSRVLARLVGVSPAVMAKIENQDWVPGYDVLTRIARTLALDSHDLVSRAERAKELEDIANDPGARPMIEALLRTTKDLPPEEIKETLQRLRDKVAKSKP